MLIDYEKKLLYLREEYDRVWVGENDPTTSTTTTSTTTTTTTTAPMFQDDDFENGSLESFWTTDFGVGGAYAEEGGAGNLSSSAEGLFGGGVVEFGWIYQGDPDFEGDFNIRVQIGDFTNMTDNGMICGIVAYVDNNNWALIGKRWYYGLERHATHRVAGTYRQTPDTEDDASDPQWYRIERVGSTFNTYWSNNGTSWNLLNPPSGNLSHSGAVKIGFFASDENSQPPGPFDANFFIIENI
jgi:regulation of enolase protein 1 (concanavalin A-like superfamily)